MAALIQPNINESLPSPPDRYRPTYAEPLSVLMCRKERKRGISRSR